VLIIGKKPKRNLEYSKGRVLKKFHVDRWSTEEISGCEEISLLFETYYLNVCENNDV
jgi:hypothetical protein